MKTVFQGKLLHLAVGTRRLPNGHLSRIELIRHPGAVLIVPVLGDGKYIFLKQYRPAIDRFLYEFPAGTLNKREKPLDCAKRELIEETGFKARKMTRVGIIYPVPGYSTEVITIFKAENLIKTEVKREKDEVMTLKIMTGKEVHKLLDNKKMVDAKTLSALALMNL